MNIPTYFQEKNNNKTHFQEKNVLTRILGKNNKTFPRQEHTINNLTHSQDKNIQTHSQDQPPQTKIELLKVVEEHLIHSGVSLERLRELSDLAGFHNPEKRKKGT